MNISRGGVVVVSSSHVHWFYCFDNFSFLLVERITGENIAKNVWNHDNLKRMGIKLEKLLMH